MGALDLIRDAFRSPADRRLYRAAQEAEVWQSAPAPSATLARRADAGGPPQGPPRTPSINWTQEQPPYQPPRYTYREGYSDHTYQQFSAPLNFEGFNLDAIRGAIARHRLGYFWETSALMVAVLSFGPVFAATQQAIAPILALSRHVHGGDRGLAKLVASEIEEALVPRSGLLPSPYLPPWLWGKLALYLRYLGFSVLQHVDGDADAYTGVRPRFTRTWEPWAVQRTRSPRKTLAITTEGVVEICNDGKFTLIEDTEEGYLTDAAVLALGEDSLHGKVTIEQRASFLDFFGKPKLWAKLPPKVATRSDAGDDFMAGINEIYGPDGRGIFPDGSDLKAVAISGEGASAFDGAGLDALIRIFMVLVGSSGTIGNGMSTGAGQVYQPAKGGSWKVAHHLVARPALAIARGINQGHVAPYCDGNYAEGIAAARRVGAWKYPVLSIPIVSPDRDERIKSVIEREKARTDILAARRANGVAVTQQSFDALSDVLEVSREQLADPGKGTITEKDMEQKLFAPDEYRAQRGYDPLPNEAGSVERLAEERLAGGDETGALAKVDAAQVKDTGEAEDAAAEDAEEDEEPTT